MGLVVEREPSRRKYSVGQTPSPCNKLRQITAPRANPGTEDIFLSYIYKSQKGEKGFGVHTPQPSQSIDASLLLQGGPQMVGQMVPEKI